MISVHDQLGLEFLCVTVQFMDHVEEVVCHCPAFELIHAAIKTG